MPVAAFAHHDELAHVQRQQSGQIDRERHAAHDRAQAGKQRTVYAKPTPALYEQLFTKPDEHGDANHAHDYFLRGSGSANETEAPVQIPLFHHGSKHRTGHTITFVYGYVVNNAGEKRLGWINSYLLGP